jgi:acetylornithine deacetylase/succinyl-diaminopimelate desuccinylase-like protein
MSSAEVSSGSVPAQSSREDAVGGGRAGASVRAYVEHGRDAFVADLTEWLRIPSISADPAHAGDVRRSAEWLAATLRKTGFPTVEVWETPGHPAVFAEWPAEDPGAPVVVVYGHHDVQPVDPLGLWDTPPFEPKVEGDRMRARGAADDKGQVLFHTLGVRAHLAATGRRTPKVTLRLLVEGEEESGSTHFAELLRERRDRLSCDVVVVSDTSMWAPDTPSTCTGMRGLCGAQVTLRGPTGDIHSGAFGGAVRNPLTELCRLMAGLHDDAGRVTVPGFYDDGRPLSERERAAFAARPFDEAEWLRAARSSATHGEAGFSTLERVWARPTAELNGIWGGYTGPGSKTIVPSEAHAKLSFRLVADQQPARVLAAFRDWVCGGVPDGIAAQVNVDGEGVRPCLTPLDSPALAAIRSAMARAFDRPSADDVLITREGGSGPEADLQDVLRAPVVFLGVSVPDDGWHAPNEKAELRLLVKGAETAAHLWEELPRRLRA